LPDILECNKSHNDLLASTEIFLAVPFKAREKKKDDFLDWLVETTVSDMISPWELTNNRKTLLKENLKQMQNR
jgi:hypothetical protein